MSSNQHFDRYVEHSRRLQTWIGGYGVGLAGVLTVHFGRGFKDVSGSLAPNPATPDITTAFALIAGALGWQVMILLLNKYTQHWLVDAPSEHERQTKLEQFADRMSEQWILDLIADLGAVVFLFLATIAAVHALGMG